MEKITVMNWVVNILMFSLPFSWYMCYSMFKYLKTKDKIIELQRNLLLEIQKTLKDLTNESST